MPLTWYNLADGPAPWADATSYSDSFSTTGTATVAFAPDESYTTATGSSSYVKDLERAGSVSGSFSHTATALNTHSVFVTSFDTLVDNHDEDGLSVSGYQTRSQVTGLSNGLLYDNSTFSYTELWVETYSYAAYQSNGLGEARSGGGGGVTKSSSSKQINLYSEEHLSGNVVRFTGWATDEYSYVNFTSSSGSESFHFGTTTSYSSTYLTSESSVSTITTSVTGTALAYYVTAAVTTGYAPSSTTRIVATTSTLSNTVVTYSEDGYTYDGGDGSTYSVDGYTGAYGGETIITSSEGSSTTGTNSYTYATTAYSARSYTYVGLTYLSTVTTTLVAQTTGYLRGAKHLIPVVSALANEYLRVASVSRSDIVDASELYGSPVTLTTFDSAVYSGSNGSPFTESTVSQTYTAIARTGASSTDSGTVETRTATFGALTHEVTYPAYSFSTSTYVTSTYRSMYVTQQDFDGWIGGTKTQRRFLQGATSTTAAIGITGTVLSSESVIGAMSSVAYQSFNSIVFKNSTVIGLAANGSTNSFVIQMPVNIPFWTTYQTWFGGAGQSVTTFRSPINNNFAGGSANLTRVVRGPGFQAAPFGSSAPMGASLNAGSSFFAGYGPLGVGSPRSLSTPSANFTTAQTSDSIYTISVGSDGVYAVTAYRTESSVSTTGLRSTSRSGSATVSGSYSTGTQSYVTGTLTTFTANVSVAGVGEVFDSSAVYGVYSSNRTIVGGAHAHTGGVQDAELIGACGWRYTIGDGTSTTSYKTTSSDSHGILSLDSSILAVETFSAGLANPVLFQGLPYYSVVPYSST